MDQQQVINFLNEVKNRFPAAISLAAGGPNPQFYAPQKWPQYQQQFVQYTAKRLNVSLDVAQLQLSEYGPSGGIIRDVLARYLKCDEAIEVDAEQIIVTNGFQEAATLYCLHHLQTPNDVIITLDPSFIGMSAMVGALGKKVIGVGIEQLCDDVRTCRFDWQRLAQVIEGTRRQGLNPKALYINPDFNNPLTYTLDLQQRVELLEICHQHNVDILEDSPYSRFNYDTDQLAQSPYPSLRSLDKHDCVYYLGSFSKTFCPGVRLGFLLPPNGAPEKVKSLVALKSLLSVNSSALSQAVVGGFLIAQQFSLTQHLLPIVTQYAKQRAALAEALQRHLGGVKSVTFDIPQGGFFAIVTLPFDVSADDVFDCANRYQLICMPVSFFCLNPSGWHNRVRLSFSYYQQTELFAGVARFAEFVKARLAQSNNNNVEA